MERDIAEKLMAILVGLGEPLNAAEALVATVSDEGEKRALRRGLGEIMGRTFTDLMFLIIQQYPDLDPDKDTDWLRDLHARRRKRDQYVRRQRGRHADRT